MSEDNIMIGFFIFLFGFPILFLPAYWKEHLKTRKESLEQTFEDTQGLITWFKLWKFIFTKSWRAGR